MNYLRMNYKALKFILCFFILIPFWAVFQSCSSPEADRYLNPDSLVALEINKRKVVLLGESPHNNFLQYNSLVNTIKHWVSNCIENKGEESALNLVLEIDSNDASRFDRYVKTNDESVLLEIIERIPTLETLEFFDNLKHLHSYIDSISQKHSRKIILNILGIEQVLDDDFYRKPQNESESWFVNERDRNSSQNLIRYIKTAPQNYRYLVNYGSGHLQKGKVSKNLGFSIPEEQTYGYYLAHYLKEEFGSENVLTIIQDGYHYERFIGTKFEKYNNQKLMIPFAEFPLNNPKTDKYDYIIIRPYFKVISHPISYIFSRLLIEKFHKRALYFGSLMPGFRARTMYYITLSGLYFATGSRFEIYDELRKWGPPDEKFNGLSRIDTREYEDLVYYSFVASDTNRNARDILLSMGFADKDFRYFPAVDSAGFYELWNETKQGPKFINAIGIYWLGYEDEKVIAKKYLVEFSGEDYSEPAKYLQWYRKKFFNSEE
jgi:hypothetical protein